MNYNYVLGLSLHTTAVGWAVFDPMNYQIIDSGVRLFDEGDKENNEQRKIKRNLRRQYRRKHYRLSCIKKLFIHQGYFTDEKQIEDMLRAYHQNHSQDPYTLRQKGLSETLSTIELYIALYHIAKRRGDFYRVLEDECLPIQDQLQRKHMNHIIRDSSNRYSNMQYIEEAFQILNKQNAQSEFIRDYIQIIAGRRTYYDGPGNAQSTSPYKLQIIDDAGIQKSIFLERLRGYDRFHSTQLNTCKECYSVLLYKLLNELNIALFDGQHLTSEEKRIIILYVRNAVPVTREYDLRVSDIEKALHKKFIKIEHTRVNHRDEPVFTNLYSYQIIRDICRKENFEELLNQRDVIDHIIEISTLYQREEKLPLLQEELKGIENEQLLLKLSNLEFHGFFYLSLTTIDELLVPLLKETISADDLLKREGYYDVFNERYHQQILRPVELHDTSAAMKRSYRQTLRIINAIEKKYGIPSEIHIHVQRNANSSQIRKYLDYRDMKKKQLRAMMNSFYRMHAIDEMELNTHTKEKVKLYVLQKGRCLYTGDKIDPIKMIRDFTYTDIDHIIPQSVSFDDSTNNKVLTTHYFNHQKSDLTPLMYMKYIMNAKQLNDYRKRVGSLYKTKYISKAKLENLLFDEDIRIPYVRTKVQNKVFQDPRKFTRQLNEHLSCYYAYHKQQTKIIPIHPNALSFLHRKLQMFKNSNHYQFFSEEAVLSAVSSKNNLSYLLSYPLICNSLRNSIEGFTYKFSRKIEKHYTGPLSDDTIFKLRLIDNKNILIRKRKLREPSKSYDEFFSVNAELKDKLLMAKHDVKTYECLCDIYERYHDRVQSICRNGVKNPFLAYELDTGEKIRKYSKKGNGPIITTFQFEHYEMKAFHDISYKYEGIKGHKKAVLNEIRHCRIDVYFDESSRRYKIAVVTRMMCRVHDTKVVIYEKLYKEQLEFREIDDNYAFKFSLYPGDFILLLNQNRLYQGCLRGCASLFSNTIKCSSLTYKQKNVDWKVIGPGTKNIQKFVSDVLGNHFEVKQEVLKMEFDLRYKKG